MIYKRCLFYWRWRNARLFTFYILINRCLLEEVRNKLRWIIKSNDECNQKTDLIIEYSILIVAASKNSTTTI